MTIMGIPLHSLPKNTAWVKSMLNRLQTEYREGGVSKETILACMKGHTLPKGLMGEFAPYTDTAVVSHLPSLHANVSKYNTKVGTTPLRV